jgi:CRP-like cAMP-binding protein
VSRDFGARELIAHKGEPFSYMYFPVSGVLSEIEEGSDGGTAEVTIIGFEGCSGIEALAKAKRHPFLLKAETPVSALAILVADMIEQRDRSAQLHTLVHAYLAARIRGAGISLGCYARHSAQAGWRDGCCA